MELKKAIAAAIAGCAPSVQAQVIETVVSKEVNKRATAIATLIDMHSRAEAELRRLKPDVVLHDAATGDITSTSYSAARFAERAKLTESIERIEQAVHLAIEENNYDKAYALANKAGGGKADQSEAG